MATKNGILTLCVGNCGIFAGNEYYSTIMNEHKLDKNGIFTGDLKNSQDSLLLNKIHTYFVNDSKINRYIPRAIFIDIDASPINKIAASSLGSLLSTDNMLSSGYNEPTVVFPRAYNNGSDLMENILDKMRKQVEICDCFQGINMMHCIGGGTGSGLAALILSEISNNYPRKYNFTHTVMPCIAPYWRTGAVHGSHNNTIEIYNTVLALNELIESTQMNFVIDNPKLLWAATTKCNQKNADYNDMNWIMSLALSGVTSPFRLNCEPNLCSNLKKMDQYFRLFPRLHFVSICQSPFFAKRNCKYNDHNIEIVSECFENQLSRNKVEDGKLFATATFYRSNDVNGLDEMNKFMALINKRWADDFVAWIPQNVTSGFVNDGGFECYKDKTTLMATTIMNTTAMKGTFQIVSACFAKAFKRKSYFHCYKREGTEQEDFQIADKNIRDLVTEWQDKQDYCADYYDDYDDEESESDDDDDDDDDDEYSDLGY